jgi:hypothetical protein
VEVLMKLQFLKLRSRITPTIWFISVVIFALFLTFVLPQVSNKSYEITQTTESPDGSFFYTPEKLYDVAEAYGEAGRSYYIKERFSFDLIWPLVYWFFLITSITILYRSVTNGKWLFLSLLPSFGVIFDYLENFATSLIMFFYPRSFSLFAWCAPFFTSIKWSLIYVSFLVIIIGCLLQVIPFGKKVFNDLNHKA